MKSNSASGSANSPIKGEINWRITLNDSIAAIPQKDWERCAKNSPSANPLTSYALLKAMEESGSACIDSGWMPRHITLSDDGGHIHGVMPLYLKFHSYGEYVFDHAWAEAWGRFQQRDDNPKTEPYYPKAQSAIPFSPVPGQRLLVDSPHPQEAFSALGRGAIQAVDAMGLSGLHITFLTDDEARTLCAQDPRWIPRHGVQFHWHNNAFSNFDDFLSHLTSRRRKTIRRERQSMEALSFRHLRGDDIKPHHWQRFYQFYLATIDKKWGGAYLTREFFDIIGKTMADQILLIIAEDNGTMIAGALNFIGSDTLYGRNWGCLEDRPFLHFETCYYQALDFALEHGLKRVEAGAQGFHKVQRGYAPVLTHSLHYLSEPKFAAAIADFTRQESAQIKHDIKHLESHLPYSKKT